MHVQRAAYCPGLRGAGGESLGLHSWSLGGARLVPVLVDWHVHHCAPWAGRLKSQSGPTPLSSPLRGFEAVTGDMGCGNPAQPQRGCKAKYFMLGSQ